MDARRIKRSPDIHRIVERDVTRVVGIGNTRRAARLVAQLVGPIPVTEVEHRLGGGIADSRRRGGIGRAVTGVVAETPQQRIEDGRGAAREEVDRRAVGGEADRLLFVRERARTGGLPQEPAESGGHGPLVIGSPGVVHAGVRHRQRPCNHRWAQPRLPHCVQEPRVPSHDDAVLHLGAVTDGQCPRAPRQPRKCERRATRARCDQQLPTGQRLLDQGGFWAQVREIDRNGRQVKTDERDSSPAIPKRPSRQGCPYAGLDVSSCDGSPRRRQAPPRLDRTRSRALNCVPAVSN